MDTRHHRLIVAGALRGLTTISAIARRLGVHRTTLHAWTRAGDPSVEEGSLVAKALQARFGDEGPLTAARIAEALECPEDALHPGGPMPTWGEGAPAISGQTAAILRAEQAEAFRLAERLGIEWDETGPPWPAMRAAVDRLRELATATVDSIEASDDLLDTVRDGVTLVRDLDRNRRKDADAAQRAVEKLVRWADSAAARLGE